MSLRCFVRPFNSLVALIYKRPGMKAVVSSGELPVSGGDQPGRVARAAEQPATALVDQLLDKAVLNDSERINAAILVCLPHSIIATDINGLITVFSPGAENMLGYAAEEMVGKQTLLLIHDSEEVRSRSQELAREKGFVIEPDFDVFTLRTKLSGLPDEREWTYLCKDGSRLDVLLVTTTLRNDLGEIDGYLGVATDITGRKIAEAEITRMAYHDQLTRLPNRRLLHDRMQVAIAQARRETTRLALMLIDLDKFKPVNDNLGHAVGDLLLRAVAERMQACLRESDTLARIGGDEFVVLLPGIETQQDALGVAEKIRLALNEPFELEGGYKLSIACSIGIALYPDHGRDEKRLLKIADDAMYAAKELGRNRVQLFTGVMASGTRNATGSGESPIARLIWRKAYKCGEASIDQEHLELFDRANTLINSAIDGKETQAEFLMAFDDLINCVANHFANEEAVLARFHYTGLDDHVLKHQRLVGRVLELRDQAVAGELTLGNLVSFLVQDVVVKHMLEEDVKFFPLLRKSAESRPAGFDQLSE